MKNKKPTTQDKKTTMQDDNHMNGKTNTDTAVTLETLRSIDEDAKHDPVLIDYDSWNPQSNEELYDSMPGVIPSLKMQDLLLEEKVADLERGTGLLMKCLLTDFIPLSADEILDLGMLGLKHPCLEIIPTPDVHDARMQRIFDFAQLGILEYESRRLKLLRDEFKRCIPTMQALLDKGPRNWTVEDRTQVCRAGDDTIQLKRRWAGFETLDATFFV